jgi:hypothetical protein
MATKVLLAEDNSPPKREEDKALRSVAVKTEKKKPHAESQPNNNSDTEDDDWLGSDGEDAEVQSNTASVESDIRYNSSRPSAFLTGVIKEAKI